MEGGVVKMKKKVGKGRRRAFLEVMIEGFLSLHGILWDKGGVGWGGVAEGMT